MLTDRDVVVSILTKDAPQSTIQAACTAQLPWDRIIVISNGSCDEADLELRRELPAVHFVQVRPARGLTYSWNLGVRLPYERGWQDIPTWTVIANDDIVFDADWLEKMDAGLEESPNALHVGMAYPKNRYSCFAVHRDLIRKIGWFDERFTGIFFEDDDWHLRLSEYAGTNVARDWSNGSRDGIFTIVECALHDHNLHAYRAADRRRFGFLCGHTLSREANEAYFRQKWRRAEKGGWASKGKIDGSYGNWERVLPDYEWYPLALLGGRLE